MRLFLLVFIFFSPIERASAAVEPSKIAEILKTTSSRELSTTAASAIQSMRRARGCEIQRRDGVPPTLCYPSKNVERLDSECVRASRTAIRIPAADEFTSPVCRDAIEKRSADLAYASVRDASR